MFGRHTFTQAETRILKPLRPGLNGWLAPSVQLFPVLEKALGIESCSSGQASRAESSSANEGARLASRVYRPYRLPAPEGRATIT